MTFLDSIVLGIVEGLTEFLPVSSTGHLILTSKLLGLEHTDFLGTFEIAIQLGAILAVVTLYWRKLFCDRQIMERVAIALLPALGVGFVFYSLIKQMLGSATVVVVSLFVGGLFIILFEWWYKEKEDAASDIATLPLRTAFFIGLFQAIAVIPGVSRAGSTIIGGLLLGLKRTAIVEFSFLLAVPTMVAATSIQLFTNAPAFSAQDFGLLSAGFVTSFLVALAAIKFFLRFVATHTFMAFGVYRIAVALLFFFLVL